MDDIFSISALHLAIKAPYFSNSGHKNEKVTTLTPPTSQMRSRNVAALNQILGCHGALEMTSFQCIPSTLDQTSLKAR
eukprot:SAG31_NODE_352_length_17229_cov_9.658669_17_plen_78_part_00